MYFVNCLTLMVIVYLKISKLNWFGYTTTTISDRHTYHTHNHYVAHVVEKYEIDNNIRHLHVNKSIIRRKTNYKQRTVLSNLQQQDT